MRVLPGAGVREGRRRETETTDSADLTLSPYLSLQSQPPLEGQEVRVQGGHVHRPSLVDEGLQQCQVTGCDWSLCSITTAHSIT